MGKLQPNVRGTPTVNQVPEICAIGAGPSGLTAARNAMGAGLNVTVFEQNADVGGNWLYQPQGGHSSVYENTHIISSRAWSEYEDFPMPPDYPEYPDHRQLQAYFSRYADHFGVRDRIQFGCTVTHCAPEPGKRWRVRWRNREGAEQQRVFTHLMVCNGHHWNPRYPEYPGRFTGQFLHSHDFKRVPEDWPGKRILIIGAGNSACDVAVEAARVTRNVALSMRSAQWFLPKYLLGQPIDVLAARTGWLPGFIARRLLSRLLLLLQGRFSDYGLPEPDWQPFEGHPTVNQDLLPLIRHGRIRPLPAIERLEGDQVCFANGERHPFDIIVAATGFWISFPFFDPALIDFRTSRHVPLYRRMLHPDHPTLYFIGLFQPLGCIWPLADYQAMLACQEILGRWSRPDDLPAAIEYEARHPHFNFRTSLRHSTEVDYHRFRSELVKDLEQAGIRVPPPPMGRAGHYRPQRLADLTVGP
jgi:cation diffusion facilitator CzcD-associated flavoprotein CzcO